MSISLSEWSCCARSSKNRVLVLSGTIITIQQTVASTAQTQDNADILHIHHGGYFFPQDGKSTPPIWPFQFELWHFPADIRLPSISFFSLQQFRLSAALLNKIRLPSREVSQPRFVRGRISTCLALFREWETNVGYLMEPWPDKLITEKSSVHHPASNYRRYSGLSPPNRARRYPRHHNQALVNGPRSLAALARSPSAWERYIADSPCMIAATSICELLRDII